MKTRWYARQLILFAFCFSMACSSDSCSCDGFVQQEFPVDKVDKTIPSSGTVRLTADGLGFLEDNLDGIIGGALGSGNGLEFCVPEGADPKICYLGETCNDGSSGCQLTLDVDSASFDPEQPNVLNVEIVIGGLDETISVEVPGLFSDRDCLLTLHHPSDQALPAKIGASIPITFTVDQTSPFKDVRIEFGDLELNDDELDFDIDGNTFSDIALCETVDGATGLGFIRDALLPVLQDQFEPLLRDAVDGFLCVPCDNGCPGASTCNVDDNTCRFNDDTCPQNPLGISGQLDLGAVLADFTEEPTAAVDLTARVADQVVMNDGVTLALRSGFDPVDNSICVPADPTTRKFTSPGLSPTMGGNLRPDGTPFHFGLAYHKQGIEELLWSVWASGGTCLKVGTESFDLVTTGAFGALLPSIRQLTYSQTSAAYVKIVPQLPPKVTLGANDVVAAGNSYTINDPLMTVDWKDFDIHIYGFVQDRFTRILTIRVDLLLPIALAADGMGGIVPILGDFEGALTNERILEAGLVAEDPERVLELLPTLIGFALPALGDSLAAPIEIPEFFGFRIKLGPGDITSIDNNQSIAIFGELELAGSPYAVRSQTSIAKTTLDMSRRTRTGLVQPQVKLNMIDLPQPGVSSLPLEYSYRVDGANWSMYVRSAEVIVDHPLLVMPGEHTIEVRARYVGQPYTVDPTPAKTTVVVDWEAPTVEIERNLQTISLEATDLVDRADQLEYRHKLITGNAPAAWSDWSAKSTIDLDAIDAPDRFRLDVEARDRAGNVGADTQTVTWHAALEKDTAAPTTTSNSPQANRFGCTAAGGANPTDLGWLLLVAAGLFIGRRRRRRRFDWRLLGLLAVLAVSACKCGDDTGETLVCEPACAEGSQCVEGECVVTAQCSTDEDCPEGERCNDGGTCIPDPTCDELCDCPDGEYADCSDGCACIPYCEGGCEDGTFCCYDSDSCETLPDPCADQVCDPGFGPAVETEPNPDNETCDIKPGTCGCEKLPPLPLGWHGHYASIDRNAGTTAIGTYNSTYEDLMIGTVNAALDVTWYFVDGVPAGGDVEGALDGPRGGVGDKGEDVGRYTSLVIDDAGNLHAFYRDDDNGSLKWAQGTPNGGAYDFAIEVLDDEGDTGYWTSAVYLDGKIHVVYSVFSVDDGAGGYATELRHIAFDTPGSPADPTATRLTVVSGASDNPCGVNCERRDKCIVPLAACQEPTSDCADDCAADGNVCWMGSCVALYEKPANSYARSLGTNAELSATPDGGLLLVYWDYTQNSVVWTRFDGTAWGAANVLGDGTGPWASGMVDANDNLHLAYMEGTTPPQLTYRDVTNDVTEIVVDGMRDTVDWWLVNDIGEDVDLRVATDGTVELLFQDATQHTLNLATRNGANSWTVTEVAAPGDYTGAHGFYATMLKLPDVQFSVDLVIDNQADPTVAAPEFHE